MSLPNYLAKIKSSGLYRFTFDKSQIPSELSAETMRLVVGYSEKGPFNNPVYIDNKQDFISLFGNINKRLEKKGVFFHRLALQALSAGPILALNLKPFNATGEEGTQEQVGYVSFDPCDVVNAQPLNVEKMDVLKLFDRNRFWKINSDDLVEKVKEDSIDDTAKYINIVATDVRDLSCSIFVRKCNDSTVRSYNVSIRDWYKNLNEEMPEYLEGHEDDLVKDYFAEVYVFRGEFTESLTRGVLSKYFDESGCLKTDCKNVFGDVTDALQALATDENSNCIGIYRGCLLPYFKDNNGNYISLDILFNSDKENHKMVMKLNDSEIYDILNEGENGVHNGLTHWACEHTTTGWDKNTKNLNTPLKPTYIEGYTYGTLNKKSSAEDIYIKTLNVLAEPGIFEALTNHVDSEFHYIIDTYATLVKSNLDVVNAKTNISFLAKTKDNCLAIMNAPAMADLQKIPDFSMKEFEKGTFSSYFSVPSETNGASYCAYYTPLIFGDGIVRYTVPSAAIISNLFIDKWYNRQPYYIVAGPNYGRLYCEGMVGPDYNYSRDDLDILEPMGINAIVYVPRKGTFINSNQTAKQIPVSALSKVHVRELVIYIQNEIEKMLQNYQWELNTQTLRDKIKNSADAILDRIKNNGGVYEYLNVCDGSNNTPDVIDNEMVILDTSIEPARGAGKMVQRLTIHRTGGLSALIK